MSDHSEQDRREDDAILHGMGYAQEPERSMIRTPISALAFPTDCLVAGA